MDIPKDIIDGLNGCPLTYAVPREDVVHLFQPRDIQLVSPVLYSSDPSQKLNGIRSVLNGNDNEDHQGVIDGLLRDFEELELPELQMLKFRKPAMKYNKHVVDSESIPLGRMDEQILNLIHIDRQDIIKPSIKLKRIKLRPKQVVDEQVYIKNERKHQLSENGNEKEKEEEEEDEVNTKSRKTSYLQANELTERAGEELMTFIDQIGLTDKDVNINGSGFFVSNGGGDLDFENGLSNDSLNKIHNCLLRLQDSNVLLVTIPIAYLIRIQEFCCKSLRKFTGVNWSDVVNFNESLLAWYNTSINAAIAAVVMMQLFLSKRNEKILYLETYLYPVLDFVYSVLEIGIIPLSKLVISDARLNWKNHFIVLQQYIKQILAQLNEYLKLNNADEGFITKLEYLSSMVLFADTNLKEKSSVVGVVNFESLRISCCDIMCTIFHNRQDQRQFILDEILSNWDKLPTSKTQARQYKLSRGFNVQLVSILLIRLLHTFHLADFPLENENISMLMNTNWDELSKKEQDELLLIQSKISSFTLDRKNEMINISNQISSAILNKFVKNIDTNSKHVFEILLEDLLNIVNYPECAGGETLLFSLMRTLMYIFGNETYSAPSQTFALEMIGSIGCKILQLRNQRECIDLTYNMSVLDLTSLTTDYTNCLIYLQEQQKQQHNDSFQFLLLKAINSMNELWFQTKPNDDFKPSQIFDLCYQFQLRLIVASKQGSMSIDPGMALTSNLESLSVASYNNVLLSQDLLHLYDEFLNLVVRSLDHNKIKSRTRAIKNLSSLMSKEPSIMQLKSVSNSVIQRLNDNSAQVRDAAIELIGQFLSAKPDFIEEYYQIICQKMDDSSIAVRKRVIKLCKEIYNITASRHVKALICEKLLKRLEDEEDNIIEMARFTLLEFWFFSLVNVNDDNNLDTVSRPIAMSIIDVILDVVDKSEKNWEYFTMFLSDHVLTASEDDPPTLHSQIMNSLKIIIDKTLDFIIECVDNKALQKKIARAMGLLSVIIKEDGTLISQDQLICLKPYLTDESSTGDSICYYTLTIFRHALPQATVLKPSFIKDSQISLLKRLTKFNVKELAEAMPCVWALSLLRNDTARMATAAISCLKLTRPFLEKANKGELIEFDPKLLRLLYLIGNFGKYCDFQQHRKLFMNASCGLGENEPIVSLFVKFLLCFANESLNHQIKRASIKNLIYICSSHAKLFMTDPLLNIMDRELKGSETDIKSAIVQEFIEFLQYEESLNLKTNKHHQQQSAQRKLQLDISVLHGNSQSFVTDGICASLVQRYMEPILQMCLYENGGSSMLATRYLQLVVKLGFSNPKLCIPSIVALESSPVYGIRSRAIAMHKDLFAKHESLIESGYVEGVKLAFQYRKRLSDNYMNESNFIKTFYQVIGDSKVARRKFLNSLTKSFVIDTQTENIAQLISHKEYVIYVLLNLKTANIAVLEEAYIICNAIDTLVSSEGVSVSLKISAAAEADPAMAQWPYWCCCSQLFMALLRYRDYLFQTYNLNEDKAMEFQQNKVDKDLRVAPKHVRDIPLKLNDLLTPTKEDQCRLVALQFVQLINGYDGKVV